MKKMEEQQRLKYGNQDLDGNTPNKNKNDNKHNITEIELVIEIIREDTSVMG